MDQRARGHTQHGVPRRLIVPLDGSEQSRTALVLAGDLAQQFGADVSTVAVRSHGSHASPDADVTLVGDPVDALLGHIADTADALVCLTSHGRGGIRRRLIGSVADRLIQLSTAPVIVLGPRAADRTPGTPKTILAGLGWPPASKRLVALLRAWGPALRADVGLLHVRSPSAAELYVGRVTGRAAPDRPALPTYATQLRRAGVRATAIELPGDDPVSGLLRHAESVPRPVLLAVEHERDGHHAHHDVAYQLVRHAPWPVLATTGASAGGSG